MKRVLACALLACVTALGLGSAAARGAVIAYDNFNTNTGLNQNFGNSLGLDFNVTSPAGILVTALGAYNSGLVSELNGVDGSGVTVAIFDRTTGLQVGASVHFDSSNPGTQVNSNAFLPASIFLPVGFQGSVVAFNDRNFNSSGGVNPFSIQNDGGGLISFVGGGRFGFGFGFPTNVDGGPTNRYNAGTFQFIDAAAVPEPASLAVFGLVAGAACFYGWRSRKRDVTA